MGAVANSCTRKEERHTVNVPSKVRGMNGKIWVESQIINISKSGACLKSTFCVSTGNTIMLSSVNSNSNSGVYCVPAKVVWFRDGMFGVRFIGANLS